LATIGWIKVGLAADTTAFTRSMKTAASTVRNFGASAASGIGKATSPFAAAAKASADSLSYAYGPAFRMLRGFGTYLSNWGKAGHEMFADPLTAAFRKVGSGIGTLTAGAVRLGAAVGRGLHSGAMRAADGVRLMGRAIDGVGSVLSQTVGHLTRFGLVAGTVAGVGIAKIVDKAANLTEALNLVKVQFGDNAQTIIRESELISGAVGTSRTEFLGMAGALSAVFSGAGLDPQKVAELSGQFARLAIDTESLYNLGKGEAAAKIMSGLTGQIRPLREIGILIDDNKVEAQAYAMGLAKAGEEVSQEAKVLARIPLILSGLSKAQGDRARTAEDTKNATREVEGRVLSLAETIGQTLDPIARSVLGQMGTALGALQMYWRDNQNQVASWSGATVAGTGQATQGVGMLQQAIGSVADAWRNVSTTFGSMQAKVTSGIATMVATFPGFAEGINKLLGGTKATEKDFKKNWLEDLGKLEEQQKKSLAAELAKPMPSAAIADYFAKAKAETDKLRGELLGKPMIAPPTVGNGLAAAKKVEKPHGTIKPYAGAVEMGSREAYSAILEARAQMPGGRTKTEDKIEANTREMAVDIKAMAVGAGRLAAMISKLVGGDQTYSMTGGI
jgi:hypothetical protein